MLDYKISSAQAKIDTQKPYDVSLNCFIIDSGNGFLPIWHLIITWTMMNFYLNPKE